MARPKTPEVEAERQIRVRAVADDERSGRFEAGKEFDMPFKKALFQMEVGKVEPVFDIKDKAPPIPKAGCSFYEAYSSHMKSYQGIAELVEEDRQAIGNLNFEIRYCQNKPSWGGISPPNSKSGIARTSHLGAASLLPRRGA